MKTNATDGHVSALEGQIRKDLGEISVFIGPLMDPRPLPFRPLPAALVVVQNGPISVITGRIRSEYLCRRSAEVVGLLRLDWDS
jgi:hypothetical protein